MIDDSELQALAQRLRVFMDAEANDYSVGVWTTYEVAPTPAQVQAILSIFCASEFGKVTVEDADLVDYYGSSGEGGSINNPLFLQYTDEAFDSNDPGRLCKYLPREQLVSAVTVDAGGGPLDKVCVYAHENRGYLAAVNALDKLGVLAMLAEPVIDWDAVATVLVNQTNLGRAWGLDAAALRDRILSCSSWVASTLGESNFLVQDGGTGVPYTDDGPVFADNVDQPQGGEQGGDGADGTKGGGSGWLWAGVAVVAGIGLFVWAPWKKD